MAGVANPSANVRTCRPIKRIPVPLSERPVLVVEGVLTQDYPSGTIRGLMRLKPLYRLRMTFADRWSVGVVGEAGREDQVLTLAEGRAEGDLKGRFRATDYPRRRTDGTVLTNLHGVLETDDGAAVLVECHGFGRTPPVAPQCYPPERLA